MPQMRGRRPRVVIVGAGFGGLWAARELAKSPMDVLIVDRNNYHTFLPLLYQVAAAELEPEQIVHPVRSIIRSIPNTSFSMSEVTGVDYGAKTLKTSERDIPYDYLIVSAGSATNYFGISGADRNSYPLKTLEEGIALRNKILCSFEKAEREPDVDVRRRLLTFVVVGGGPTGVEYAGALSELVRGPLAKDYPCLDQRETSIILIEALGSLLSMLPDKLGAYAAQRLGKMGVDVRLQTSVSEVTSDSVRLSDGSIIESQTVVWTAGVRGDPLAQSTGLQVAKNGRATVQPTLQSTDHPDVYIVGDLANIVENGHPLPMVAPVAMQQGTAAARNIVRQVQGQPLQEFAYRDPGTMATIGRNAAVAHIRGRAITGFPAWLLWVVVHIFSLIGFRNRLFVLINWAWDYFAYERSVRLILSPSGKCLG